MPRPNRPELILLLIASYILARQLLLPGYIGLANNGDFPKVIGRFDLGPADGRSSNFLFFVPSYQFGPQNHWISPVISSEIAVAALPIWLVRATGAGVFNIRAMGLLNSLMFLAAFYAGLIDLRRFGRTAQALAGMAALWILADVAYAAYFNSFYSDSPAILGALLTFAGAIRVAHEERPSRGAFALFAAGALLFVTSKSQHGLFAIFPAAFAAATALRAGRLKIAGFTLAAMLLGGGVVDFVFTPKFYAAEALFNVIFLKMTPHSATPLQDIREFGLPGSYSKFVGSHAFMPDVPVADPEGAAEFLRQTGGYTKLLRFYLRHPEWPLRFLRSDLESQAPFIRPNNLSNFPKSAGRQPGALTMDFASWSDARSSLFLSWPWYVPVWLGVFLLGAATVRKKDAGERRVAWFGIGVAVLACLEFAMASLADGGETYRHLLIFHLMTDFTFLMAIVWGLNRAKSVILRSSLWQN